MRSCGYFIISIMAAGRKASLLLEEECLLLAASLLVHKKTEQEDSDSSSDEDRPPSKKDKRLWIRPWLQEKEKGYYKQLLPDLLATDPMSYKNFLRVNGELFAEILQRVTPRIQKQDTNMRDAIEPGLRLAITLRYLATGDSYQSAEYGFRVAANTISGIVPETCEAIINEYMDEFIPCPNTPEAWMHVAEDFSMKWQFHNCLGAIDGKHVAIKCPANGGSTFFNYKGFHSIILMALYANYKFLYVDIGANGSCSDGGVFKDTGLFKVLDEGRVGVPEADPLPQDTEPVPYSIVGDDAFAMRTWLMKPYPQRNMSKEQRIFNYRLSRARRVVENAFGILVHR